MCSTCDMHMWQSCMWSTQLCNVLDMQTCTCTCKCCVHNYIYTCKQVSDAKYKVCTCTVQCSARHMTPRAKDTSSGQGNSTKHRCRKPRMLTCGSSLNYMLSVHVGQSLFGKSGSGGTGDREMGKATSKLKRLTVHVGSEFKRWTEGMGEKKKIRS